MTEDQAERILDAYEDWKGKKVVHRNPMQIRVLLNIRKKPQANNSFDVEFTLDDEFMGLIISFDYSEKLTPMLAVNHKYFKPNFRLL